MKQAPKYMNDVVENVQEELVKLDLNDGERGEKMVKIDKGFYRRKKEDGVTKKC